MAPTDQEIIDSYHRTRILTRTARELRIDHKVVISTLNRHGIQRYHGRKHFFNQSYFDTIDTEEKAYFLGLLWADGNNASTGQVVSIKLSEKDKYIIDRFRLAIGSTARLYHAKDIKCTDKDGVVHECRDAYSLSLSSRRFSDKMTSIGFTPRKTKTLRLPSIVPDSLLSHFVRGCFDGDGSITRTEVSDKEVRYGVEYSSKNPLFAEDLNRVFRRLIGVEMKMRPNQGIVKMYLLDYETKISFLRWIYKDATIYLTRKYDRYLDLLNRYQAWKSRRTTPYRGISLSKTGVYSVRKVVNSKTVTLGRFKTEAEAVQCLNQHLNASSQTT